MNDLPLAQIRAQIGFPDSKSDRVEVLVAGVPVAKLHPTAISYEMDWKTRLPQIVVRFIAGDADLETRPPFPERTFPERT